MKHVPPAVGWLAERLGDLGWVSDLLVAGSLATGDYVPGVSDLDLVAVTTDPVSQARQELLAALHRELDQGPAQGLDLGCVYADAGRLADPGALHPTWTHGSLVQRSLSGVTRAELVRYGFAVLGRPPAAVLPEMTDDDVRRAARAELCGYWAHAARRPLWWLSPVIADLGLTSMARGRHALRTGQLLTKTQAIERAHAPAWLKDQLRARRQGQPVTSPRARTALIAWRDARRTVADARRGARASDHGHPATGHPPTSGSPAGDELTAAPESASVRAAASRNGRSAMTEPVTTLDPRYSDPAAVPTPWAVTREALEAAELAWLVTLHQDGRPHATPVVPVWVDDSMHFTTGATEQKAKNLRDDNRVLLQVGGLDWQGGLDIAVEGRASLASDPSVLGRLAAAWRRRWDGSWTYEVQGDRLLHQPEGFEVLTYSVRPDRVLTFAKGTFGHTLHRFSGR